MKATIDKKAFAALEKENERLHEDVARARRVGQIAMRDAIRHSDVATAVCLAAESAQWLLGQGQLKPANMILDAVRAIHLDHLRGKMLTDPDGTAALASHDTKAGGTP